MRIVFVNRFFPPDHSATSQIVGDLAFHFAASGHEVHAITSRQLYEAPQHKLPSREIIKGVQVHRVPTTSFGRAKLIGRALDYLSFYFFAWRALRALLRAGDIVIAKTDPPLISIVAMYVAKKRKALLVNWLQDVYPEVAAALEVPLVKPRGFLFRVLCWTRNHALRRAAANVVVGERMAEMIVALGAARPRIHVIHNWTDDDVIMPLATTDNLLRRRWGLQDHFVVGYSGNLGRAHEFETLLGAADLLRDQHGIVFLFIGGGHRLDNLRRQVETRGLQNFRFVEYQKRTDLGLSLAAPDVHWLSLRPELEGLIVPSKFYGIAAAGRPIIVIGAKDGELARLVRQCNCGVVVEPGQSQALVKAILALSAAPKRRAILGQNARAMLDQQFGRAHALSRWDQVIAGTCT
jgi:glycosyltransferase involved in cell wall biosynthesis